MIGPEDYREQMATVDRYIAGAFNGSFTPEDREDIAQDAFAGLELTRATKPVKDTEAVLITCARNAAVMRLRSADHSRRHSFDPQDSPEARIPDHTPAPEDLVVQADEERRVHMLIELLGARERSVLKLRLQDELPAKEIAHRLDLSVSLSLIHI